MIEELNNKKLDKYEVIKSIIVLIVVICIIVSIFLLLIDLKKQEDKKVIHPCDNLNGTCKYYKCQSEQIYPINFQNKYLLQYQNCLLEEQLNKSK